MFYWRAIHELGSDRPSSMGGMVPIPLMAILTYGDFLGLTQDEQESFVKIIRAVDLRRCILHAEAQARKNKTAS